MSVHFYHFKKKLTSKKNHFGQYETKSTNKSQMNQKELKKSCHTFLLSPFFRKSFNIALKICLITNSHTFPFLINNIQKKNSNKEAAFSVVIVVVHYFLVVSTIHITFDRHTFTPLYIVLNHMKIAHDFWFSFSFFLFFFFFWMIYRWNKISLQFVRNKMNVNCKFKKSVHKQWKY